MTILQTVMQKFTRKHSPIEVAEKAGMTLSELVEHYQPLMELQAQRQLIEVIPETHPRSYQSMVLEINFQQGYLVLDELFPTAGFQQLRIGDQLTIKHHRDGQVLSFNCTLLEIKNEAGSPCCVLTLPQAEQVDYQQRRIYPRLQVSKRQPLTVSLQSPNGSPWFASIHNLSASGMRVAISGNVVDDLGINQLLPHCEFKLSPELLIRCQARIRGYRFMRKPYRHTQVSLLLVGVKPEQRIQLQQFINAMAAERSLAA